MTVRELVEQLATMPQDAVVNSEGFNDYAAASRAVLLPDGEVLIERDFMLGDDARPPHVKREPGNVMAAPLRNSLP